MNKLDIVKNVTDKYILNKQEKEKVTMKSQQKNLTNNSISLSGEIVSSPEFSHEVFGEGFYTIILSSRRTSGNVDVLPVVVSERLVPINLLQTGQFISVKGQIRTINKKVGYEEKSRLILSVFAQELEFIEDCMKDNNCVTLTGFLCKTPIHRTTPLGRELCEVLLAVNRLYRKSDYIPTLVWGRNSHYANSLEVGTQVKVSGRLQSRLYDKSIVAADGTIINEKRTTYELSVSKIEVVV